MASGEEIWAQAWSEPESGSDLASLRSTATRTDGGWLLNGQKIWSSRAVFGDRAFGLFRSDPEAQRHKGLTYFMFELKADGVTVRPIAQLGGDTGFGEIFLDDVFVPDEDVIGGVNDGWRAAMSTSSNERGMSLRSPARFLAPAERLVAQWKDNPDPAFTDRVADAWIKAQAYRLHTFGTVTRVAEAASSAPSRRSPRCSGPTSTSRCTRPRWTSAAPTANSPIGDRRAAVRARRPDLCRHQRDSAQHHRRAAAGPAPKVDEREL